VVPSCLARAGIPPSCGARVAEPKAKAELGASLLPGSPAEFGKLIADRTEKWATVAKFAGIKPE
jgi:hypothetical protein